MEAFETFEHAGYTCELHYDEEPWSPAEWDTLGTLVAFDNLWREYRFAARNSKHDEDAAVTRGGSALLVRYLRTAEGIIAVPFTFQDYGSGGARLWGTDEDDDNPSGFIFTTPALCDRLGVPVEDAERQLRGKLRAWDAYVEGRVAGYVVRDRSGNIVDSVWGFYPDENGDGLDYVRQEAREIAEYEAREADKWASRNVHTEGR